ncbi:MAG: ribonuclease Z [Bacteroidota bacterium]
MRFELIILGTSGGLPTADRNCSAAMLRTETTDVLIDCGEGTQRQLLQAGLGMGRVSHILITHLHGDHYFGLPGLFSSLGMNGRKAPLTIVSPQPLRPRIAPMLEMDTYAPPFPVHFETILATEGFTPVAELKGLEVFAFPLQHRVPTNGYLLREKLREANIRKLAIDKYDIPWPAIKAIKAGADYTLPNGKVIPHEELTLPVPPPRSYAHCSDTVYFPELAQHVNQVDLLYHEATFLDDMAADAAKKGHSTAREAAVTAKDAQVGQLVMGHLSSRYENGVAHDAEARAIFPNSHTAKDFWRVEVPFAGRGKLVK